MDLFCALTLMIFQLDQFNSLDVIQGFSIFKTIQVVCKQQGQACHDRKLQGADERVGRRRGECDQGKVVTWRNSHNKNQMNVETFTTWKPTAA